MSSVNLFMRAEPLWPRLFFKGLKAVAVRIPSQYITSGNPGPWILGPGLWDAPGDQGAYMPRLWAITVHHFTLFSPLSLNAEPSAAEGLSVAPKTRRNG